jgi:hypothetical protein
VTRIELAQSDVPGTDLETRLYLITYPAGAAAPVHHHAGANVPHTPFENANPRGPLRFLIAYTVKKGAPVIEVP